MLSIESLNQYYGQSHTLWDVSLTIQPGICTCLMGRNGVGKTTLLKSIMGLLPTQSGHIVWRGEPIEKQAAYKRAPLGIGYVPQGREIFPLLTVEENLRIGLKARKDGVKEIPEHIFELFPVLKQMHKRRGGDLSGGQQQQLAIGRALVIEPSILILDEPTEGIQPNVVREIGDILQELNRSRQLTVLLVEQKLPIVRRLGQAFHVMDRGRVVAGGNMDALSDDIIQRYLTV